MKRIYGSILVAVALAVPASRAVSAMNAQPLPVAVTSYTVQPGDTLWTIARRLDPDGDARVGVDRLMRLNGLRSGTVYPGRTLQIPAR